MPTLLLTRCEVSALLTMPETLQAVEQAFIDYSSGAAVMPPKAYLTLQSGDFRAMPASVPGAAGLKWVNVHTANTTRGLPTVMAIIIYSDPDTGYPLAIMDGTDLTAYRTGAGAAIASKHLARKNSRVLGLIGAGRQAETQLLAHAEYFRFDEIRVYDRSAEAAVRFKETFRTYPIRLTNLEEACGADIVCTLTPSRAPYVRKEWLKAGVHINAVGADAPGKVELHFDVIQGARVVVDDTEQAIHAGELNVPFSRGLFHPEGIYATLGDIAAGKKPGRTDEAMITIFDSTGLAIQDIATARLVYHRAKAQNAGQSFDFIQF